MAKILIAAVVIVFYVCLSETAEWHKDISDSELGWAYVGRFAFNRNRDIGSRGSLNFTVTFPGAVPNTSFAIYRDFSNNSFSYVWKHRKSLSCWDKLALAESRFPINETKYVLFDEPREVHFWYFFIVNCEDFNIRVRVDAVALNPAGGHWQKQFSVENQGLGQQTIIFWFMWLVGLGVHLFSVYRLQINSSYHVLIKMYSIAFICLFFSNLFVMCHYASYASNGVGSTGANTFGGFLLQCASILTYLIILAVGNGYPLSNDDIGDKKYVIVVGASIFLYFIITFFALYGITHAPTTLFRYQSGAGVADIIGRDLIAIAFYLLWRRSYSQEGNSQKRSFYIIFFVASISYLVLPTLVEITAAIIAKTSPWDAFKWENGLFSLIDVAYFLVLQFLFWYSRVSDYFAPGREQFLVGNKSSPYEAL